jgi:hypothetical protein
MIGKDGNSSRLGFHPFFKSGKRFLPARQEIKCFEIQKFKKCVKI